MNTLKTHSTPRTTTLPSWPSTSTDVRFGRSRASQMLRLAPTFEATSTCFPPPVNNHRKKGNSCRGTTLAKAAPSSASIKPPYVCDGGCFHLTRKGNLRIEMHFATALKETVNVVVYGELEAVLDIDKGRNIIYNY